MKVRGEEKLKLILGEKKDVVCFRIRFLPEQSSPIRKARKDRISSLKSYINSIRCHMRYAVMILGIILS